MKKSVSTTAFKKYCQKVVTQFASGEAREHAYRPALQEYIESFSDKLRVTNEPGKRGKGKKGDTQNKPDFIVTNGQTPLGFVEAKDINIDLDDVGASEQIDRYCEAYPNLILTDYLEFRRYVKGKLRGKPIRIGAANEKKNEVSFTQSAEAQLTQFFEEFLLEDVQSVASPQELASRLASLTRQIKKLVRQELEVEEESARLHKLMVAFQKVLLADLNVEKFSDMFAQTLAYGFFAARVHYDGQGEFSRRTASSILPKTNPFLRRIFAEFANESLPESLVGAVDEVVDLLRKTDIKAVLNHFGEQGRQDPVVHFYESFLAAYDPKLKKAMGVFYTPDAVVSYMVRSLDELLIKKFGRKKGLADDKTIVLDPALGTGSYLHKVVEHIHSKVQAGAWDSYVGDCLLERIFGFEILMAPYAVAHLNLGMQLQKTGYQFARDQRLGVYLTNTLEETAKRSEALFSDWISEEADAAAEVKRQKAIMVVTGNPPYSGESQNDGPWIRDLMRGFDHLSNKKCANYFECEGKPLGERNPKWLNDDYVKFIRFAHWRIEQTGHGIVAFITNHGYLDNPTFRGMREALMKDFDEIYIFDLHGNAKKKEQAPDGSKDENVFDIQQGVSIALMVRNEARRSGVATVYRADLYGSREHKFDWLKNNSFSSTKFKEVKPESPAYLYIHQNHTLRKEFEVGEKINEIFPTNSVGVVTARDGLTIKNTPEEVWDTIKDFISRSPSDAREHFCLGDDARDWKVDWAIKDVKKSGPTKALIKPILYRPFDIRHTYYTGNSRGFICMARGEVMANMTDGDNIGLAFTRPMAPTYEFSVLVSNCLMDQCAVGNKSAGAGISYLAPLWIKNESGKTANLSPTIRNQIKNLGNEEEFIYYAYATLNSSEYKERYAEFLKADFPRIQITTDRKLFQQLSKLGSKLGAVHTLCDDRLDGSKVTFAVKGSNVVDGVRFDSKAGRVYLNAKQYFENVTVEMWGKKVGGYNVLEKWLKDRRSTTLTHDAISTFERIAGAIELSQKIISQIDVVIKEAGGWPLVVERDIQKKAA